SITQRSRRSRKGGSQIASTANNSPTGTIHKSQTSARLPLLRLKGDKAATGVRTRLARKAPLRGGVASHPDQLPQARALRSKHSRVMTSRIVATSKRDRTAPIAAARAYSVRRRGVDGAVAGRLSRAGGASAGRGRPATGTRATPP